MNGKVESFKDYINFLQLTSIDNLFPTSSIQWNLKHALCSYMKGEQKMKRLLAVLLSVVVIFSFAGETLAQKPQSHGCKQKGDGTFKLPYTLCVASDFELMHTYPDKYFELGANIKFSDFYTDANPWRSIPNFSGSVDGKNHTVSQLISGSGLIKLNNGKVNNLKLKVDITGFYMTGGIAGTNYGEIVNSRVDGRVSGRWEVGAIAGMNYGVIKNSQSSGSISVDITGGGLVGYNEGIIIHSSSSSSVNGSYNTGGLVGTNRGTILRASSSGTVVGHANGIGGLVGNNDAIGKIQFSRATGDVYAQLTNSNLSIGKLFGSNIGEVLHSNGYGKLLDIFQY